MSTRRLLRYALAILTLATPATVLVSGSAFASQDNKPKTFTYNGVTVSPAIVKVNIQPGQPKADFNIEVTNNTPDPVNLNVSSVDFKSLNSSGGLAFVSSNSSELQKKHGLANWLNLGANEVFLEPKQSKLLPMYVENRDDLSPGGHYAAVLFKSLESNTNRGQTHVSINQVVSSLVFVQKLGGEKYGLSLKSNNPHISWFHLPDILKLTFTNTGNIQQVPRGLVTISDPIGREVARGQVNTDSSLVLPESSRLFRTPLLSTGRAWLPGIYTIHTSFHSEGPNSSGSQNSSFVYLNIKFLGLFLLTIFVVINVVRKYPTLLRWKRRSRKH